MKILYGLWTGKTLVVNDNGELFLTSKELAQRVKEDMEKNGADGLSFVKLHFYEKGEDVK